MTSGTFSYPSQRNTGYKVTAEDYNEFVDDLTYIGRNKSIEFQYNPSLGNANMSSFFPTTDVDSDVANAGILRWLYDRETSIPDKWRFNLSIPLDYGGSPKFVFSYYANGTPVSGTAVFSVEHAVYINGGTIHPSLSAPNYGTIVMPGTINTTANATISITAGSTFIGGGMMSLILTRLAGTTATNSAGTVLLFNPRFNYEY